MHGIEQAKRKRLLTRAAEQGLVHPKLARMGSETLNPRPRATAKETVLSAVLSKLRMAPAAQKNYMRRLAKVLQGATQTPQDEKPEYLCCPICIDLLVEPLVLHCGHSFCRKCLETTLDYKKECPMCREGLKGYEPNPCLNM